MSAGVTVFASVERPPPVIHTPIKLPKACALHAFLHLTSAVDLVFDDCRSIAPDIRAGKALLHYLNPYTLLCKFNHCKYVVRVLKTMSADFMQSKRLA